jgi:tRNA/rRNA methyltransferase
MLIHFILVEPAVPENVGAAARALKTMGFRSLRLVNPCEYLSGKAQWVAHASEEILNHAKVFSTLEEAITDVDFVIATSAAKRSVKADRHAAEKLPELLNNKTGAINSAAIVFGREESGLTNAEIALCHITSRINMATQFPSLNLGQAVMLYAYILSGVDKSENFGNPKKVPESKFKIAMQKMDELLAGTKITRMPVLRHRIFERLALLGNDDLNLLLSALSSIENKLKNT